MSKLFIDGYEVEVIGRIEQKRAEYPLCDSEGKPVIVERTTGKATYKNQEGTIISKTYRLINGKPFDKFKKTDKVSNFAEVPKTEVYDLITECYYLCRCENLKEKLKEKDTALKFISSNGNGYKAYISYLTAFQDKLIKIDGFGSISNITQEIESETAKIEETQQDKVEVAQPEQLLLAEIQPRKKQEV